ncbi:MAG: GNAT family N-acetyltransferase [Brevundimonas sp.]
MNSTHHEISELTADQLDAYLDSLSDLLHACVHAGASVNFIMPFPKEEARRYWLDRVFPDVGRGTKTLFIAIENGKVAGSVQLDVGAPPNQAHRADILKLLVAPEARRRGLGSRLMAIAEAAAQARGRWLLTLDTRTGDIAEPLYLQLGYTIAGVIPEYCRDPHTDALDSTTLMYKRLAYARP